MVAARNSIGRHDANGLRHQHLRFVVDGPYSEEGNKPVIDVIVYSFNNETPNRYQCHQRSGSPELVGSFAPSSYLIIPMSLFHEWDSEKINNEQFVTQGTKVGVSGATTDHLNPIKPESRKEE